MTKNSKKFKFRNNQGVMYEVGLGYPWELRKGRRGGKRKREKLDGYCAPPSEKQPKILIRKTLGKKRLLNVSIEEFAHAFFWDKKEKEVRPFATALRNYLYKEGWRKSD